MALRVDTIYEETVLLQYEYNELAWFHFRKKREIKEKIYALQIPMIQEQISDNAGEIKEKLTSNEYSRIYVNTFSFLLKSKKHNSKKFHSVINPNSKKNVSNRKNLLNFFYIIIDTTSSYSQIENALKRLSKEDRTFFEKISRTELKYLI